MERKNEYLIMRVSVVETLRTMPKGKPVTFDCREAGPVSSWQASISRLRSQGHGTWNLVSHDNGITYTITRME